MVGSGLADRKGGVAGDPVLLVAPAAFTRGFVAAFLVGLVDPDRGQGDVNVLVCGRAVLEVDGGDHLVGKLGLEVGESEVEDIVDEVEDDSGVVDVRVLVVQVEIDTQCFGKPRDAGRG